MSAGAKRSKPAATAVWVVKRLPARGDRQRDLESPSGFLHEASGTLQYRERRVTFVQMADFRLDAERREQSPSADPEQHFLLEAQLRPAAV